MPLSPALYLISLIYSEDFSHLQGREALPCLPTESAIPEPVYTTVATTRSISRGPCVPFLNKVTEPSPGTSPPTWISSRGGGPRF